MNELVVSFVAKENKPAFPEVDAARIVHVGEGASIHCAIIEAGMQSGLPSVALKIDLPDGRVLMVETSARLFVGAAQAMMARHPDLFGGCGHQHADPNDAFTCATVQQLHRATGQPMAFVVLDGALAAHSTAVGNVTDLLFMATKLCESVSKTPRPTDCDGCAGAHDRLTQAAAILRLAPGRC